MQHYSIICKHIAFTLLAVLIGIMALATFVGNSKGIDYASSHIYYTVWFALMWMLMAGCGITWLWASHPLRSSIDLKRNAHLWLIHGALCVILLGAGISALTSWSGQVHLRLGEATDAYQSDSEGNAPQPLPFKIELSHFDVATHSGTQMASNYISHVKIEGREYIISMNKVPTVKGVRLYQASFDSDGHGSTLLVRSDPFGQPVTYTGYALLLIAMIVMLFAPQSGMRRALQELRKLSLLIMLSLFSTTTFAQNSENPRALPRNVAEEFGHLYVSYGGRICPMQTLAQDFCRKVSGKSSWKYYTAEQIMTGWLFWPDDWNNAAIIQVKSRALRKQFDLPRMATFNDFFYEDYRLGPLLQQNDNLGRAAAEVDDKLMLIYSLRRGELFTLFPIGKSNHIVWSTPTDQSNAVKSLGVQDRAFVQNIFPRLFQDALSGENAKVLLGIEAIAQYQQKHAGATLPSANITKAERIYNSFELPTWLYRLNLTLGLLLFLGTLWRKDNKPLFSSHPLIFTSICGIIGILGFVALTAYMALRTVISGRLPLGNGYETMLTVAWMVMLIGALLWRKASTMPMMYSMPFISSGFFLLVASLSQSGAEITQLMPVLNSPLLSLHVSIIMLSYALLSFTFLLSLAALLRPANMEHARWQSLVILYPAIGLLSVGIFLGAVWANVSWGRYWGWDPKEVWALITLIIYVVPLHAQSLPRFRNPRTFHIYLTLAFATVLMTYFGVNYVLTGLHSYA